MNQPATTTYPKGSPKDTPRDNRTFRALVVSRKTGHLLLRFPYNPELDLYIRQQLSEPTYIEGNMESGLAESGQPLPVSATPMLYRIGHPDTYPHQLYRLEQMFRQWPFALSREARATLSQMRKANDNLVKYGRTTGPDTNTLQGKIDQAEQDLAPTFKQNATANRRPEITGITGRDPSTAKQVTALKIQLPRPDDDELQGNVASQYSAYNQIQNPDGVYDTIMSYPGSQWVKGKKGQYRGYFRCSITHDTPKLIAELRQNHKLLLDPALARPIAERIDRLNRDLKLSRNAGIELSLPAPAGLDYLPYQKAGIAYAVRKGNALIADEPGLGKTIQAVGVSNAVPAVRRILLIVPASLKLNWAREWRKWCVKGLSVGEVTGGKPHHWPMTNTGSEPDVVVINYDLVNKHYDRLTKTPWDLMVVDEAHALKNDKTQRTTAILGGGAKEPGIPRHRTLLLTGTPILNRPKEIWTLANALDPDYFHNKMKFALRYCNAHETEHGWNMDGASNLSELYRELRSRIMVRRRKADVLKDLPPKTRQIIPLSNDALVRREKQAFVDAARKLADIRQQRADLNDRTAQTQRDSEAYLAAARRLTDMEKAVFERLSLERKETAIAKVGQVMQLVEQGLESAGADGKPGKVILFAHHREVIEAYEDALTAYFRKKDKEADRARPFRRGQPKPPPTEPATIAVVSGKTPKGQRQGQADKFQSDPNCRVFLGSIGAAGTGFTLTQSSLVIFGELDWVPGIMSQAEDRAHRIGQLDNVLIWHAVVDGSIDARMVRRLIEKQEVLDAALDDEGPGTGARTVTRPTTPAASAANDTTFGDDPAAEAVYQDYLTYLDRQYDAGEDTDLADALADYPETGVTATLHYGG
ncbi:MAG: helicase domain-containing protein [Marinobacter sp. T13-3]|nr:MAG: helicase domain-containing protein [Marinobacter sp. T13-3]